MGIVDVFFCHDVDILIVVGDWEHYGKNIVFRVDYNNVLSIHVFREEFLIFFVSVVVVEVYS